MQTSPMAGESTSILLVQTPNIVGDFLNLPGKEVPLAMCHIAAYMKREGFDRIRLLDLDFHNRVSPLLEHELDDFRPDIVGVTSYTTNITIAGRIARTIKDRLPDAVTVLGGFHASALPERTAREFPAFDYLVAGEGEITLTEMARRITAGDSPEGVAGVVWREGEDVRFGEPRPVVQQLDDLPFPDRSLIPVTEYVPDPGNYYRLPSTGILFSRGCPFRCTYCSKSVFHNRIRYRSVGNFLDEVQQCIDLYGIRDFRLEDEGPTANVQKMKELCREILARGMDITWNCFSRVDTIDDEALELMKDAGCYHITYGVESANPETLKRIRKPLDLTKARGVVKATRRLGIECKVNFIFGFPWESTEDMKATIRFADHLAPDLVSFNIFKPLPGSVLYNEMEAAGTLRHTRWEDYFVTNDSLLFEASFTEKDLRRLIRRAFFGFYLRPRFVLQRFRRLLLHPSREWTTIWAGIRILAKELWISACAAVTPKAAGKTS